MFLTCSQLIIWTCLTLWPACKIHGNHYVKWPGFCLTGYIHVGKTKQLIWVHIIRKTVTITIPASIIGRADKGAPFSIFMYLRKKKKKRKFKWSNFKYQSLFFKSIYFCRNISCKRNHKRHRILRVFLLLHHLSSSIFRLGHRKLRYNRLSWYIVNIINTSTNYQEQIWHCPLKMYPDRIKKRKY